MLVFCGVWEWLIGWWEIAGRVVTWLVCECGVWRWETDSLVSGGGGGVFACVWRESEASMCAL